MLESRDGRGRLKVESLKSKVRSFEECVWAGTAVGEPPREKYGKYKICDERIHSYWVPGLVELIFPDWF